MATETFAQLVERAQKGDQDALERLLEDYGDAIQREVRFCLLDSRLQRVVGESDICQAVMLRFMLQLREGELHFDKPEDLVNLLKAMARARAVEAARFWGAQRRDVRKTVSFDANEMGEPATDDASPSGELERKDLLERALERLSERDRRILRWRQDDVGWPEIARRLGLDNPEALRKQHHRALDRVAREMFPSA